MENTKDQHSFNPQDQENYYKNPLSSTSEKQQKDLNDEICQNINMKNEGNVAGAIGGNNQKELNLGQKRKYTKRMQNLKAGEGDSKSVSISGKDKNMGRWTRDEKQKFIDAIRWHGKDWKKVEQSIKTRSGAQIRSHAQKFFQNKLKSEGIDIDQYIQQLQQNQRSNKDVESSNQDEEQEKQIVHSNALDQNFQICNNAMNDQEIQYSFENPILVNKFVSVVNIDAPQNIQDKPANILQVIKTQEQMALQKNRYHETESQQQANQLKTEQRLQNVNLFPQQGLFFSSSTPSEISSYVHQNLINKIAQDRKDQSNMIQQNFKGPLNLLNLNDKNKFQHLSNSKLKQQAQQLELMNNRVSQSIQNIFTFNSGQDLKNKNLKLSPSKFNSPIHNLQRINTAKWNDSHQIFEQKKMNQDIQNLHYLKKNEVKPSKIKIQDENESPIKVTICDDTSLEVLNLDLSQILKMPKVLRKLKEEIESFNPKVQINTSVNQQFKISAIKICWHINKNELFVYDFQEKQLDNYQDYPISILNIMEKNKAGQRA